MISLFSRILEYDDMIIVTLFLLSPPLFIHVHLCLKQMHKLKYDSSISLFYILLNIRKWHLY